jgi:hypothetical protein
MSKGFGPEGPGGPGKPGTLEAPTVTVDRTTAGSIASEFTPAFRARTVGPELQLRLGQLVAEGLQLLEHASLVRAQWHTNAGTLDYAATRLGRAALEHDAVDRILGGGSLLGVDGPRERSGGVRRMNGWRHERAAPRSPPLSRTARHGRWRQPTGPRPTGAPPCAARRKVRGRRAFARRTSWCPVLPVRMSTHADLWPLGQSRKAHLGSS